MNSRNLKVLMTSDTVGGVWNYSLDLSRALLPYGVNVHLVGLGGFPSEHQIKELESIPNINFYPTKYKLEWMENAFRDIEKTEERIYQLCKIIKPDILHFNNYIKSGRFFGIPQITVYHSCVQTWWQAVKGCLAPNEWKGYLQLIKNALNNSDVVIFPTESMRRAAMAVHNVYVKSKTIPNGKDMAVADNVPKEKIILCTGRVWDEAKNLLMLCSIADQLPWPVYVAGDNTMPGSSKKVLLDKVRFLGKLDTKELFYWLERTEIYINPALYEPFGLAVLEAAKAGCALALSKIETLEEIWKDNAIYFNPKNKQELLDCLLTLIENNKMRKEYQQKAMRHAIKYNGESLGKSYHNVYQSIIQKRNAQTHKKSAVCNSQ